MNCPYCGKMMSLGKSSFVTVQGFAQIIINYESDAPDNSDHSAGALVRAGDEVETYYCNNCKKIMPVYNRA